MGAGESLMSASIVRSCLLGNCGTDDRGKDVIPLGVITRGYAKNSRIRSRVCYRCKDMYG